jgi:hypothetical protein
MDIVDPIGPAEPSGPNGGKILVLTAEQLTRVAARSESIGKRILRKAILQVHGWNGHGDASS